jgi:hypothetical protein
MKRLEQFLSASVVFGGFVWLTVACQVTPAPLGGQGGSTGSPAGGSTRPSSSAGGNADQGGRTGSTAFVLPDAMLAQEDVPDDSSPVPASGDANCGSAQSKVERKPADVLLVLDRSTSMGEAMDSARNCPAGSTTCAQRWSTIVSSLGKVLTSSSTDIEWGLKFFASPGGAGGGGFPGMGDSNCYVSDGVEVGVGSGNADKIQTQIGAAVNGGHTPTRAAIDAAVAYLKTVSDGNNRYILLATDGEPNCPADQKGLSTTSDLDATTTAVKNAVAAGFKVFVIGVGTETGNLTKLAEAGGTDKFYSALTPDDMFAALSTIVGTVTAGCTYELPSAPVAPNAVGVYVDKNLIPQSDSDGWSYAPGSSTTIEIHGSVCDDLKSGKKTLVEIFLPCEESAPIPTVIP